MTDKLVRINGINYPLLEWDVTQYGRDLEVTYGKGKDVDWTAGLGHGYVYSDGFDASLPELRLSPHRITLAVPEFTEKHGAFWEVPQPVASAVVTYQSSAKVKGNTANLTVALDAGSGDNRLIIVNVAVDSLATTDYDSPSADFPTYGGVRMALREVSATGSPGYMVFYLTNPASGSNSLVYPNSGTKDVVVTAVSLYNVLQVDPFSGFDEDTGTSLSPSSTATGYSMTVGGVAYALRGAGDPTITASGANHTLRQSDQQGVASDVGGAISTRPGTENGTMAYTLSAGANVAWKSWATSILPSSSGTFVYTAEDEYIHKHTATSTATAEGAITEVTDPVQYGGAEFAGRPEMWHDTTSGTSHWYIPAGGSVVAKRLSTIGATADAYTNTDWYCIELCSFQDGATPELAAGYYYDTEAATTKPIARANIRLATTSDSTFTAVDDGANWTEFGLIGNGTTDINAVVETGGFVLIAKEDCLFEIDRDQVARPVVPKLPLGNTDQENGKYTTMFGDICLYPRQDALWGYLVGRESAKIGVEALIEAGLIPLINDVDLSVSTLPNRRPYSPVLAGAGFYYCHATSTTTGATIYQRKRRDGDPPGLDWLCHMLWDGDRWKGGFWDSQARLWVKEATTVPANRGLTVFHTGADGSPNTATRRGDVSKAHYIEFPPVSPLPFRTTQLRAWEVTTANTWDATTSLELAIYLGSSGTLNDVGTAITSAGTHVKNPTVGTADTSEWYMPVLILTTNGSYTPLTSDPHILRMRLVFRTPQVTRYTIAADNETIAQTTPNMNYKVAHQTLQRLMNQGPVTVSPPDQYGTGMTFGTDITAEVVRVDERVVRGNRVIDCYIEQWVIE
jgi:hypothetical protein